MAASTDHFTRWSWTTDRRTSGSPASLALLPLDCATGTGPWTRHFKRHFSRDRYLVSVQIWRPQVPHADPYTSASCISKSIMFLYIHIVGRTVVLSDFWRRIRIFIPIYSMYCIGTKCALMERWRFQQRQCIDVTANAEVRLVPASPRCEMVSMRERERERERETETETERKSIGFNVSVNTVWV